MSVKDLETNEIYNLKIGKEAIMGRGKFGITSKYVSAKQISIDYTKDEQCFIKKLSDKVVYLNNSGILLKQEYEVQNDDILEFGLDGYKKGRRARFQFILPEREQKLVRTIVRLKDDGNDTPQEQDNSSNGSSSDIDSDNDTYRTYDEDRFDSQDELYNADDLSDESDYVY